LEELIKGNVKPVLDIVGKNLNKNGRIIQHACVVAAHQRRLVMHARGTAAAHSHSSPTGVSRAGDTGSAG